MSPVRTMARRTFGRLGGLLSTAVTVALFLGAVGALFAFRLEAAEGTRSLLPTLWALSAAPCAPILAALLGMRTWSDEYRTGGIDMLLTTPVRERDFVLGKFLGVFTAYSLSVFASIVVVLVSLRIFSPPLSALSPVVDFLPGVAVLLLQGALWCAVSVAASSLTAHAAVAAALSTAVTFAIPRGIWMSLLAWTPQGRPTIGEMPLDAHVSDIASGLISPGIVVGYFAVTLLALFVATRRIEAWRYRGGRSSGARFAIALSVVLAAALAILVVSLASHVRLSADIRLGGTSRRLSDRTCDMISEAHGSMTVTCFMPRNDADYRLTVRFMRQLRHEGESRGGLRFDLRYVDPRWDVGDADRLVRLGAKTPGLVLERGRRLVTVDLSDGLEEREVSAAIQQLVTPPQRRSVYWTTGHGEYSFSSYESFGMSDIARELSRNGYRNIPLDLGADGTIPSDCALIVVAGARSDFARTEFARLEAYLREGGRMLALVDSPESGGIVSMLPGWGARAVSTATSPSRTLTGTDVVISDFSSHAIVASLVDSRIVLDRPVAFVPSAAADVSGSGADRIEFTPLASVGDVCYAAVVERGGAAGADLSLRPTRIVMIGDSCAVLNGSLRSFAGANRDFFLNCVAYLSGVNAPTAAGADPSALASGLDRAGRLRLLLALAVAFPGALFLFLFLSAFGRRHR